MVWINIVQVKKTKSSYFSPQFIIGRLLLRVHIIWYTLWKLHFAFYMYIKNNYISGWEGQGFPQPSGATGSGG